MGFCCCYTYSLNGQLFCETKHTSSVVILALHYFPSFRCCGWRIAKTLSVIAAVIYFILENHLISGVFWFTILHRQQQQVVFMQWKWIYWKLESDASDQVQSERPEDNTGFFKYHGFLEQQARFCYHNFEFLPWLKILDLRFVTNLNAHAQSASIIKMFGTL